MESKQQQKKGIRGNVSISELLIINDDLNREDLGRRGKGDIVQIFGLVAHCSWSQSICH